MLLKMKNTRKFLFSTFISGMLAYTIQAQPVQEYLKYSGEMITIPAGEFIMGNNKGSWDDPEISCTYRSWYLPPDSGGVGPGDSDYIGFRMAR
jgi:hypothetical protein